jgi:hypothetical protein
MKITHDKIVKYIGNEQTNFICMQPVDKLEQMKTELLHEFNKVHPQNPLPTETLFKYTIELELINRLLTPIN